ncbi:MAG: CpsD/CapB family tyrosine-protein kinase, partial [Planctomycetota bacterium]|nr:CpsD/CapB family tyrosine-protein kinase [Planctomycetota bacterium]
LDKRFHTPFDVAYHLRLPYLGVVPRWQDREKVITADSPDSHRAEVYAHLCANIRHALPGHAEKKLLVASATKGEGKSTVAANLAIRYALEGNAVILVDADIRCPQGHRLLDVEVGSARLEPGLSEYLAGEAKFADILHPTATPGLRLIPAGKRVRNPVRLFYSPQMRSLLQAIEREAEVAIFDCPAVLPVVDATILAPDMRGVLLVIAAEEVEIEAVRMAIYRLQHVGARLCGAVLNKVGEPASRYVYYGSYRRGSYYYSPTREKET